MTDLVSHKIRRIQWHHVRHTYLADVGSDIDIPLREASKLFDDCLLEPPYPTTRYFEIEIDEIRDGATRTAHFQTIVPVHAQRKPDLRFLNIRLRRGRWTVTGRIHFLTDIGEAQWAYTDDFHLLFLSSGGRHDHDTLIRLITDRLNTIALSFRAGCSIPSEFENQLQCRRAIDTLFRDGVDGAFRTVAVYQDDGLVAPARALAGDGPPSGNEICTQHGRSPLTAEMAAGLNIDISAIEELRDLSWLS